MKEYKLDQYFEFTFNTQRFDTGAATDADSTPTYRVYEENDDTVLVSGNAAKRDDANTTGYYYVRDQITESDGFEIGKTYEVRVEATVNSVSGAGVVGRFAVIPATTWNSLYAGTVLTLGAPVAGIGVTVNELRKYVTDILGEQYPLRGFVASVNDVIRRIQNRGAWSFWESEGQIAVPDEYSTGTVTVSNASPSVVGSGVTWTSAMEGRQIRIAGGSEYNILSLDGSTFTLESNFVGTSDSGLTYAVYQSRYPLASDMERIIGIWDVTNQRQWCVTAPISHQNMQVARLGASNYWSRTVATFGRDSSNNYYLRVDPAPASAARVVYWYYRNPTAVTGPGSRADMPPSMDYVLKQGLLARHMQNNRMDGWRDQWAEFREMMEEQWGLDKPLQLTAQLARADGDSEVEAILQGRYERLVAI